MKLAITNNIQLAQGTPAEKRAEIKAYFNETFSVYEKLYECLRNDDVFYQKPQTLRHPLIFYFGHTATFFINKLILAGLNSARINARFESVFAIGVDEMSWDDLDQTHYDWPTAAEVRAYRSAVRDTVNALIDSVSVAMPIDWNSPMWPIIMGIEHERIHLETTSVLIRQLDLSLVKSLSEFAPCLAISGAPKPNELIPVNGKIVSLGKPFDHHLYGWDNEYGVESVSVDDFSASKYLVSNEEYLGFMRDGGYHIDRYWSEEGLGWRNYHCARMPEFWRGEEGAYRLRLMTSEIPLPLNWPVEVCYLEASAFCRWKSEKEGRAIRLPDEAQYRRLMEAAGVDREHCERPIAANWNLEHFASAVPVDRFAHGEFFDVVGNVWQWNETPIHSFDQFRVHPLYDDFSVPTFDNRHNLIKGGSWISTGNEIAFHSRYAFRRHFYQHAGFRYVQSDQAPRVEYNVYETDLMLSCYCELHFGKEYFGTPVFSAQIARMALDATNGKPRFRALDIGCSVGRVAFELAAFFDMVDGLDFSARFIQMAQRMQNTGEIAWELVEEGDLRSFHKQNLVSLKLSGRQDQIRFFQADACNLKSEFSDYDLVIAANLIDRLYDPVQFLREISCRIRTGGVLLIASPYSWSEEYTRKEKWIGGFKRDGENVSSFDGLCSILDPLFTRIGKPVEVPFVIRETAHRFQHSLSQVTLWQKK